MKVNYTCTRTHAHALTHTHTHAHTRTRTHIGVVCRHVVRRSSPKSHPLSALANVIFVQHWYGFYSFSAFCEGGFGSIQTKRWYSCTFLLWNMGIAVAATLSDAHKQNETKSCQINPRLPYVCSQFSWIINHLTPNVNCSGRTAPLTSKVAFYIFIQQIYVLNILNMVYTLRFFLFKMQFVS